MNKLQRYIYEDDNKWFLRMKPFLNGKILKVGNGLGFLSGLIESKSTKFEVIDIQINKLAKNKKKVKLYNGRDFPFKDNSFDCVVCAYVLHHADDPLRVLDEMKRVGKRLIILEDTYGNIFSKIDLVFRDFYVNFFANQPSRVHWNNYFHKNRFAKLSKTMNLTEKNHYKERKRTYWKELSILEH